jgi:hypothetical protein
MTTTAIAKYFKARSIGRGRYVSLCPAHPDHSPSLVITEGRGGRTLLRCWAGCSLENILHAVSLRPADLFLSTKPMSLAEARAFQRHHLAAEARADALRVVTREIFDAERIAEMEVRRLGSELAGAREGEEKEGELTERFHHACSALHSAELASLRMMERTRKEAAQHHVAPSRTSVERGDRVAA